MADQITQTEEAKTTNFMRTAAGWIVGVALAGWVAGVVIGQFKGTPLDPQLSMGTIGLIGVAITGKAIQKFAEVKAPQ